MLSPKKEKHLIGRIVMVASSTITIIFIVIFMGVFRTHQTKLFEEIDTRGGIENVKSIQLIYPKYYQEIKEYPQHEIKTSQEIEVVMICLHRAYFYRKSHNSADIFTKTLTIRYKDDSEMVIPYETNYGQESIVMYYHEKEYISTYLFHILKQIDLDWMPYDIKTLDLYAGETLSQRIGIRITGMSRNPAAGGVNLSSTGARPPETGVKNLGSTSPSPFRHENDGLKTEDSTSP